MGKNRSISVVQKTYEKYKNDVQKQIKELTKCVREGQKTGDIFMMGAAYCRLSEIYTEIDDPHGMLVNSMKALTLLKDTEEYELIARAYFVLGQAYINQGNYQMSLACDDLAYEIIKRHRINKDLRIMALNNLSVSYHAMEAPKKSVKYMNECIDLLKKHDPENYTDLLMYSVNLAGCHKDLNELDRADEILDSVADSLEKVEFIPLVCDYYLRRAIVSYLRENTETGNGYLDTALKIFPEDVYPLPLYDDLCDVARIIMQKKDRARSTKIFDLMTVYAQNNEGTLEQIFATKTMAYYYMNFGEYKLASEYFTKYEKLNEKQLHELKAMQMKLYETTRSTETEIRRLKREMRANEEIASVEPLTKLMNRSALLRVSSEFIESAAKKRQSVGAIFIDIDYFKECNDTYGHAKGDEIIKEVARVCRKQETKNIRFSRYGGDEFFGITRGLTDAEVCDVARRICEAIREANIPNEKNPNGGRVTLSVGVVNVAVTVSTDTIIEIANYADKALYHAKNAGRNAIYEIVRYGSTKDAAAEYINIEF